MKQRCVLLTCHDAGGTVPPVLAIAEALIRRGHEAVVLSQPSVKARAESAGCTFVAFSQIGDYERRRPLEDQLELIAPAITGQTVGNDLVEVAKRHRADLLVVDANLAGGLAAAESLPQPSAVLLHSMYKTFVDTWFGELWAFLGPAINETRGAYGLGSARDWPAVFAGHDRLLAVVPAEFDAPVAELPEAMRYFGFLVPRGSKGRGDGSDGEAVDFPPGDDPTVLVGLSTTSAEQDSMLPTILDALAGLAVRAVVTTAGQVEISDLPQPSNVSLAEYAPHALLLDRTDVMVTHAGLGSISGALTFGVPLVCMPVNRDQPLNAQRVADFGAGIALTASSPANEIATAIERVLSEPAFREAAGALADASSDAGGAGAAVAELEGLID